jgi:pyruvate,water dikinase
MQLRTGSLTSLWFDHPEALKTELVGGKAASLAALATVKRVPPGFCISSKAYEAWGAEALNGHGPVNELRDTVRSMYAELESRTGVAGVPVAVRSSAIDEDGSGDSFAGLHDTYLNITGPDAVTAAIVKCWASLTSPRALDYRKSKGLDIVSARMGVVVQQLVPADVSAVVFSANPITGDTGEVLINANYGLGESVVSGMATPDTISIQKSDLSRQSVNIGAKEFMSVRTGSGTEEVPVPRIMQSQPALSEKQAREIAELAIDLERHCGWPVDVECAIHNSTLYVLQCRPITTL